MTGTLDVRRKRARFRAGHRGTKEMDWLLGRYADARLGDMADDDVCAFERFLAIADPELNKWILNPSLCADRDFAKLLADIREFHDLSN